jgi:hypothetical protein
MKPSYSSCHVSHCCKHFTYITLPKPRSSLNRVPSILAFYEWDQWGSERLRNLPKVTQPEIGTVSIQTQVIWFQGLCFSGLGCTVSPRMTSTRWRRTETPPGKGKRENSKEFCVYRNTDSMGESQQVRVDTEIGTRVTNCEDSQSCASKFWCILWTVFSDFSTKVLQARKENMGLYVSLERQLELSPWISSEVSYCHLKNS